MTSAPKIGRLGGCQATVLIVSLLACSAARAAETDMVPQGAMPMSVAEVRQLYSDRTWKWPEGGGYFAPDRSFKAVTGTGKNRMIGTGRWAVTKEGAMCMIADWRDSKAVYKSKKTCFLHARAGKVMYQKRAGADQWYVFRSNPRLKTDEVLKLSPGNLIAEAYDTTIAKLGN